MAVVWLARDLRLGRTVAIKRLHPHLAREGAERFTREALAAASLSHPSIVAVFDAGEDDDGGPYLVMEYVEGRTLSRELAGRGLLPPAEAVSIAIACAESLAHAHQRGVIHRDVKPGNVLLGNDGSVKLTDFGIAKVAWDEKQLTETASLIGTAAYLSPEQAAGGEATAQSDIYSLGVVLYQMITGRVPFEADNPVATALAHTSRQPDPPGQLLPLPPQLEQVVMRCLEKEPARRFPDASSLADALRALQESTALPPPLNDDRPTVPMTISQETSTLEMPAPVPERAADLPPEPSTVLMARTAEPAETHRRRRLAGSALAAVAVVAIIVWLLIYLAGRGAEPGAVTTTLAEATTTPTTVAATTTAEVEAPDTFEEALVLLTDELGDVRVGREIFPPFKADLEKRLAEIGREWDRDGREEKVGEKLAAFIEKVEKGEVEGEIATEPANRLLEAAAAAIAFLPDEDDDD
jgi:eukaryotic-like serine/threonine-protein kinase